MAVTEVPSATTDTRAVPTPPSSHSGFRRDVQGLRAVAVMVVILDHTLGWPGGGFVGVDMFFVLSGFLITGLLLREHDRKGRISIADFYRRRARRILPVSYLVLAFTVFVSIILFTTPRLMATLGDAFWTMLFAVNWHLAIEGTDYMNAAVAVSPLQHYWSLAVEEQFYFVWPAMLIGILMLSRAIARRRGADASGRVTRRWVFIVLAVLSAASLVWAFVETVVSPTFAYFSTFSRAWELGAGALVALGASKLRTMTATPRIVLAWVGIAGIVASLFVITPDSPFPAPWALLPVLATVLVVASGIGIEARYIGVLTNPVSRYLGDISYSLYLWHWPIIVFTAMFLPIDNPFVVIGVIAVSIGLSAFSYHYVENPVRFSSWLEPRSRRRRLDPAAVRATRRALTIGWISALGVVSVLVIAIAFATNGVVRTPSPQIVVPQTVAEGDQQLSPTEQRTEDIATALSATTWPATDPALDSLGKEAGAEEWAADECLDIYPSGKDRCIYGDPAAAKLAVVLGDSEAISFVPGLLPALSEQGYRVQMLTWHSCPAYDISVGAPGSAESQLCDEHHDWVFDYVAQLKPDMVFMSSLAGNVVKLADGSEGAAAVTKYGEAAAATIAKLAPSTDQIILASPPPAQDASVAECKTPTSTPTDCISKVSTLYQSVMSAERQAAATAPDQAEYVDVTPWLCNRMVCPAFIGTAPVSWDGVHLTDAASTQLEPLWTQTLFGS